MDQGFKEPEQLAARNIVQCERNSAANEIAVRSNIGTKSGAKGGLGWSHPQSSSSSSGIFGSRSSRSLPASLGGRRSTCRATLKGASALERGEAGDVFVLDGVAAGPEAVKGGVDVHGVPQHDAVEHQAGAPSWSSMPSWNAGKARPSGRGRFLRQGVAAFLEVADALDVAPVGLVVDEGEHVQ